MQRVPANSGVNILRRQILHVSLSLHVSNNRLTSANSFLVLFFNMMEQSVGTFCGSFTKSASLALGQCGRPMPELGEFVIAHHAKIQQMGGSADEINRLLTAVKLAAKVVNREINKAGLTDILGSTACVNVQGEQQQKLDVFANMTFMEVKRVL